MTGTADTNTQRHKPNIVASANSNSTIPQTGNHSNVPGNPVVVKNDTSSHIQSEQHSMTSSSSSFTHQAFNQLQSSFVNSLITLKESSDGGSTIGTFHRNWKIYTMFTIIHLYVWFTSIVVGIQGNFKMGLYGDWIWRALNYPITLSLNVLPDNIMSYNAMIGLSSTCIAFSLAGILLYFYSAKQFQIATSYLKSLQLSMKICAFILVLASFTMVFIMTSFIDCDYSSSHVFEGFDQPQKVLNRFPSQMCFSSTNITMIVLNFIGIVSLILLTFLIVFTRVETHVRANTPFVSEHAIFQSMLLIITQVQITLNYCIPAEYLYLRSVLHILLSMLLLPIVLFYLPFFRRVDNSIIAGLTLGKAFVSIAPILSYFINIKEEWDIGLGIALSPIGFLLVGFIIGFTITEIYTRYYYTSARKLVLTALSECEVLIIDFEEKTSASDRYRNLRTLFEKEAFSLFKLFEEKKMMRHLTLYFKFSILSGNRATNIGTSSRLGVKKYQQSQFSDLELVISIIKSIALQKNFQNFTEIIFYSSIVCAYFWDQESNGLPDRFPIRLDSSSYEHAIALLKKVKTNQLNFLSDFIFKSLLKQYQTSLQKEISSKQSEVMDVIDIKELITKLERKVEQIMYQRKTFWKELMNDAINYNKVIDVNRKISELTFKCNTTFDNLMKYYSHDKNTVRVFAKFNERILFNTQRADELYQDALLIEEEDSKRMSEKQVLTSSVNQSQRYKASRILPLRMGTSRLVNAMVEESEANRNSSNRLYDGLENGFSKEFNEDPTSLDLAEASDSPEVKKENLIRSALSTQSSPIPIYVTYIFLILLMFCMFGVAVVFAIVTVTSSTSNLIDIKQTCIPALSSVRLISDLRVNQIIRTLYPNSELSRVLSNFGFQNLNDTISYHRTKTDSTKDKLQQLEKLAFGGRWSSEMFHDYSSDSTEMFYPEIPHHNKNGHYINARPRNMSISGVTNTLVQYGKELLSYSDEQYNETVGSFQFMYLWHNRDTLPEIYEKFCETISSRFYMGIEELESIYEYYLAAVSVITVIILIVMIAIFIYHNRLLRKIVKLFEKNLPKDAIGKIFHELKVDDSVHDSPKAVFARPSIKMSILLVLLSLTFMVVAAVCLALVSTTIRNAKEIIGNINVSTRIATTAQKVSLHMEEIYVFGIMPTNAYSINNQDLFSEEQVLEYHEGMDQLTIDLDRFWNRLLYGDTDTGDKVLVGLYPEIDKIVEGYNCSLTNRNSSSPSTTQQTCGESLNDLVNTLILKATKINEMYVAAEKNEKKIFDEFFSTIYVISNRMTDSMLNFIDIYVSSVQRNDTYVILILFGIGGFVIIPILLFFILNTLSSQFDEIYSLRLILNYVNIDLLESKEQMRNFILHHQISLERKNQQSRSNIEEDKVRNILNASVEGSLLCNHNYEIEIYNPAAQRMFMKQVNEVVGLPMWTLFEKNCQDRIKNTLQALVKTTDSLANGETIELDGLRKNGTVFPSSVSICCTMFDSKPVFTCFIKDVTPEKKQNALLAEEKKRSENLLRNILPESVASKLKNGDTFIAEKLPDITCFFSDMVGFTNISSHLNANEVVKMLSTIVSGFDKLTDKFELEKIKTIGDAYFCVGGLYQSSDHPERTLKFAMETFKVVREYNSSLFKEKDDLDSSQIDIRVGINTGSVVAGVIGIKKFAYDLWGDTINVASRMESNSKAGRIQISRSTYERVHDLGFECEERSIEVKGKGPMKAYLIHDKHHTKAILSKDEIRKLGQQNPHNLEDSSPIHTSGGNNTLITPITNTDPPVEASLAPISRSNSTVLDLGGEDSNNNIRKSVVKLDPMPVALLQQQQQQPGGISPFSMSSSKE